MPLARLANTERKASPLCPAGTAQQLTLGATACNNSSPTIAEVTSHNPAWSRRTAALRAALFRRGITVSASGHTQAHSLTALP